MGGNVQDLPRGRQGLSIPTSEMFNYPSSNSIGLWTYITKEKAYRNNELVK
jgi:hypothetical protein